VTKKKKTRANTPCDRADGTDRPRIPEFEIFMDEEEKALFRSIGERLDKLDKVPAILERIEGQQIMFKKEIEQEIKDQPVLGSLASIGEKLDKVLTVLERIESRQIVVKKEIEQEIKDQPMVGSFASTDK
jgi:hypothetical protein